MLCLNFLFCNVLLIVLFYFTVPTENLGIIGGKNAQSYSFFVFVGHGDDSCGGALLTPYMVITAASCLFDRKRKQWPSPEQIYVLHGDFKNELNVKYYSCERYKPYPAFDPTVKGPAPFNIALVRLERGVEPFGSFARLCRSNLATERNRYQFATLIGLGLTHQNPDVRPGRLMEAVLNKSGTCGRYVKDGYPMNVDSQFCYSGPGKKSACVGDLGSPLLYKNDGNVVCILGVVSYIFEQCDHPDYPTVFTSVVSTKNWIRNVMHSFNLVTYRTDADDWVQTYE